MHGLIVSKQPPPSPRGDSPLWQAPIPQLPDDPVNAPLLARYLAHHAVKAAPGDPEPEADPQPRRKRRT